MNSTKQHRLKEDHKRASIYDACQICIEKISYNDEAMMFTTPTRKLRSGLLYQEGVRVSCHMVIKFTVAHGIFHTFLNRIQLFRFDDKALKMVKQRHYRHFWWNESDITKELILMVTDCLKANGITVGMTMGSESEYTKLGTELVEEAKRMTIALGERFSSCAEYAQKKQSNL